MTETIKPIKVFFGMGCIFKIPENLKAHFIKIFEEELVFEYSGKHLAYKNVEVQEPIKCYKVVKVDNGFTYFQTSLDFGRNLYLQYKNVMELFDVSSFPKLDNYTSLVPKTPDLNHPRANPEQPEIFSKMIQQIKQTRTAFVKAGTGSGKSVLALKAATLLKTRTLILVHRVKLLNHFEDECRTILGMPKSALGRIQSGCKKLDSPIVLATIQSVLSIAKTNPNFLKDKFGLVIYDEADITGAKEFSKVFGLINARYQIAFSATIKRGDGMDKVFWSHFGQSNMIEARGDALPMKLMVQEVVVPIKQQFRKNPKMVNTGLATCEPFNLIASNLANDMFRKGRKIVIFSDSIHHLARVKRNLLKLGVPHNEIGEFFGSSDSTSKYMTDDLRKIILDPKQKNDAYYEWVKTTPSIILATFGMMDRGISIARLDFGISLVDRSDMEQTLGRVRRPAELGKTKPLPIWVMFKVKNCSILANRTENVLKGLRKDKNIQVKRLCLI